MKKFLLLAALFIGVNAIAQTGGIAKTNGYDINNKRAIDMRQGKIVSGGTVPYSSVAEANATVLAFRRYPGLTVFINDGSGIKEYWWFGGIADNNLVIKADWHRVAKTIYAGTSPILDSTSTPLLITEATSVVDQRIKVNGKLFAKLLSRQNSARFRLLMIDTSNGEMVICDTFNVNGITTSGRVDTIVGFKQIHTTGSTVTVGPGVKLLSIDPSSTLSSLTITMPASPAELDQLVITFGGVMSTGTIVTSLTLVANSGQTIRHVTNIGAVTKDDTQRLDFTSSTWY